MKLLYPLAIVALLQACGGGGGETPALDAPAPAPAPIAPAPAAPLPPVEPVAPVTPAPEACSVEGQRLATRTILQEQYYWYTQLRAPNEAAPDQEQYFQSMLLKPLDRYSYTQSASSFNQVFTQGRRTGYGYTLLWNESTPPVMRIRSVEPLSPAAKAGLSRGDTVISIDGFTPQDIVAGRQRVVTTPDVPRKFVLRSPAGVQREITVLSADFPLSPVETTSTLQVTRAGAPVKVGYIAYNQFVGYSLAPLNEAFNRFAAEGVSEVVLDLRYNGGGSVATARDLASMIGGTRTTGNTFAYLRFNDKLSASNMRYNFISPQVASGPGGTGLPRVVIIASNSTASASELLINGLRPFMDVVLIGETTFGKPYGFIPQFHCGIFYNPVQFDSQNSAGVGGYTAGFAPNCEVPDDLDRQLGDPQEKRLRAALNFVSTGSCTAPQGMRAAVPRAPSRVLGETTPNQMFAD